eukprot:14700792-Ditylum_brightwellii.AAC.1
MQHAIVTGIAPHSNPLARAPGSLGTYMWAKAFDQSEREVVADLCGFYQHLVTANRATPVTGVTDIAELFEAICRTEEPLVFLAMMLLDAGKVACVHCTNVFRSYSGMGTEALNEKMIGLGGNVVNGHLLVLFAVEGTSNRTSIEEMLEAVQDAPVPALTDLAAHFMAQGHMEGLVLEDVGGAPMRTMNMPWCLLIPMVWVLYFLIEPMAPGTLLATMEKLVTYLQDLVPVEFYQAWCRVACVRDAAMLLQPNMMTKATPQIQLSVEVS